MTIGTDAANPHGMSLDELREFLERCRMVAVSGEVQPIVRVTLKGKIKRVEARQ